MNVRKWKNLSRAKTQSIHSKGSQAKIAESLVGQPGKWEFSSELFSTGAYLGQLYLNILGAVTSTGKKKY